MTNTKFEKYSKFCGSPWDRSTAVFIFGSPTKFLILVVLGLPLFLPMKRVVLQVHLSVLISNFVCVCDVLCKKSVLLSLQKCLAI